MQLKRVSEEEKDIWQYTAVRRKEEVVGRAVSYGKRKAKRGREWLKCFTCRGHGVSPLASFPHSQV